MKRVITAGGSSTYRRQVENTKKLSKVKNASTRLKEALDALDKIEDPKLGRFSAILNQTYGHIFDCVELLEEAEKLLELEYETHD